MYYTETMLLSCAIAAHTVNRVYCETLGDHSQPEWDNLSGEIKASCLEGVRFNIANPDATPEAVHVAWLTARLADGWAWGIVKDVENKLHPCMSPYDELPHWQQMKDHLFKAVIISVAEAHEMAYEDRKNTEANHIKDE